MKSGTSCLRRPAPRGKCGSSQTQGFSVTAVSSAPPVSRSRNAASKFVSSALVNSRGMLRSKSAPTMCFKALFNSALLALSSSRVRTHCRILST